MLGRLEALEPEIVVPGHGELGGAELIREVRSYLEDVRGRVRDAAASGRSGRGGQGDAGAADPRRLPVLGRAGVDRVRDRLLPRRAPCLTAPTAQPAAGQRLREPVPAARGRGGRGARAHRREADGRRRRSTPPPPRGSTTASRSATAASLVLAALVAAGRVEARLRVHVRWALDHGVTPEELEAMATLLAVYVGYPRASVAMEVIRDVVAAERPT